MSDITCTVGNTDLHCHVILHKGDNYFGSLKAHTNLPSPETIVGTVCNLSFHTPRGKKFTTGRTPWKNNCRHVTYMNWTEWSSWSTCSGTCGTRNRTRSCIGRKAMKIRSRIDENPLAD